MKTKFKDQTINLGRVKEIGPIQEGKFNVYAGKTYSFTVHFKTEYLNQVPIKEPLHFCSNNEQALKDDRMELIEKFNFWRIH
jgi:hypothetical protein